MSEENQLKEEFCTVHDECRENPETMGRACLRDQRRYKFYRMTNDDLRKFVDDFCSGRIFTMHHLPEGSSSWLLSMVFLPLAFGAFQNFEKEDVDNIGTIYEDISKAGPRCINGYPQFFSMFVMHKDDWARAAAAIERERKRRREIDVSVPRGGGEEDL